MHKRIAEDTHEGPREMLSQYRRCPKFRLFSEATITPYCLYPYLSYAASESVTTSQHLLCPCITSTAGQSLQLDSTASIPDDLLNEVHHSSPLVVYCYYLSFTFLRILLILKYFEIFKGRSIIILVFSFCIIRP